MSRVSFLMPTFNRAHLIEESIETITSQMAPDDELIIVVDGSDDGTEHMLNSRYSNHTIVSQPNLGKAAALNRGLGHARGRYIWVCDDDDLLNPRVVEPMIDAIEGTGNEVVFGRYDRFVRRDGKDVVLPQGYWPDLSEGSLQRHILEDCFVMQNATLARREAYEKVGPFDENLSRSIDYDMAIRLLTECETSFVDRSIYLQREHEGDRGPKSQRHAAGQVEAVWQKHDAHIFNDVRKRIPLAYYQTMFAHQDEEVVRRAALLQRGCIMARHHLWELALDDFEAAADLASTTAFGPVEEAILRRVTAGKFGLTAALGPAVTARTSAMGRRSQSGGLIVANIARGALWRLRSDDTAAARDARSLISALFGSGGLARIALRHLAAKLRPAKDNGLVERREIAPLGGQA